MFGLDGGVEIVILLVLAVLLLFGAKKLPELARGIGRSLGEFKRGRIEIEKELAETTAEMDIKR